jgi:hypothetical protein
MKASALINARAGKARAVVKKVRHVGRVNLSPRRAHQSLDPGW